MLPSSPTVDEINNALVEVDCPFYTCRGKAGWHCTKPDGSRYRQDFAHHDRVVAMYQRAHRLQHRLVTDSWVEGFDSGEELGRSRAIREATAALRNLRAAGTGEARLEDPFGEAAAVDEDVDSTEGSTPHLVAVPTA